MVNSKIPSSAFVFLKELSKHNNRDWFTANKDRYLTELNSMELFAESLLREMNKHDVIETATGKKSLHRIYRDVRFSKNKTPYNTHWGGSFKRATKARRGSYYFHLSPGSSFIACGFWGPEPKDLKRLRDEFSYDDKPIRKIISSKSFISTFGALQGDQLKTCPQGYEPTSKAIDLLRYKQFLVIKQFKDKEVLAPDFVKNVAGVYKKIRPFLDYMSEVLTTDVNGISLI
jgi:uncharacterized protein (TIGR02453 family)